MKLVPFKIMRVNYIYNFRFINIGNDLFNEIMEKNESPNIGNEEFKKMEMNSAEGFQYYLKMNSEIYSTSTEEKDIKWDVYLKKENEGKPDAIYNVLIEGNTEFSLPKVYIYDFQKCKFNNQDSNQTSNDDNYDNIHGIPAIVQRSITMGVNGNGTFTFTLIFSKQLNHKMKIAGNKEDDFRLERVLQILNLAEKTFSYNGKSMRRFGLINQMVWAESIKRNDIKKIKEQAIPILEWVSLEIESFQEWLNKNKKKNEEKILWLCREGDGKVIGKKNPKQLLDAEESRVKKGKTYPSQNPYVYIEAEAEDMAAYIELTATSHEQCGEDCLHGILQQMLARVGPTGVHHWGLNKGYLHRHGAYKHNDNFPNYYPVNYMFISTHFRSTLAILPPLHDREAKKVLPAIDRYLFALQDTINLVRCKWYYLVIEHAYIDYLIKHLEEIWETQKGLKDVFIRVQKQLLEIRFHIGKILESPIVYRRAASSLNEIYFMLRDAFNIDGLQKSLIEKLRQTMDIYEECMNIRVLEQVEERDF